MKERAEAGSATKLERPLARVAAYLDEEAYAGK